MQSIVKGLEEKGIHFSLEYYGINDYGTFYDVKSVLDNKEIFLNEIVGTIFLDSVDSLSEYMDYLCLRKLVMFQEMIPAIKSDDDKQTIENISILAKKQCDKIGKGAIIKFINDNYSDIFAQECHEYSLHHITIELIIKFQGGIDKEVFEYLAQTNNYLLITNFHDFRKRFEIEPTLFGMIFHKRNLEEMRELRFDYVFPIFISIWNAPNSPLKEIVIPIVENIIADTEELIQNFDDTDFRNILMLEHQFRDIYKFVEQIRHPKANKFREYNDWIEEKLEDNIQKYGQKFTCELPGGKVIEYIKNIAKWEIQMLSLTHDYKSDNIQVELTSRLSFPSKGKQGFFDNVSSNIPSDEYFTRSHQRKLGTVISLGAAMISALWHDEELFPGCLQWYYNFLAVISEQIGGGVKLEEDLESLYTMLQPVILSDDADKKDLSSLCYGAAMFICALAEKLLRTFYIYLLKDKMYVPLSSATLGTLLSSNNQEMLTIFGEDHLKNLSFFFSTIGDKKIGMNYRNSLAHWVGVKDRDLNSMLVAKLFYLYTDVINTIFWHFTEEENRGDS